MSTPSWHSFKISLILGLGLGEDFDLCARATSQYIDGSGRKIGSQHMKCFYLGVTLPKESIKILSKPLETILFEILPFKCPLGHLNVPKWYPKFWWFSGHKIWTQGPIKLNLVANDRSQWDKTYKTVSEHIGWPFGV